ncbi:MAG: hypothetical protein KJO96_04585 [Winogradskyella sp.]|nr:hypothetical protein [Winogradskyella sp.]
MCKVHGASTYPKIYNFRNELNFCVTLYSAERATNLTLTVGCKQENNLNNLK